MSDAIHSTVPFSVLGAPRVVHISKLRPEAIERCNFGDIEYVVLEPAPDGTRVRPADIEDQVKHEQEGGLGHVTYSLGEFLDEFTKARSNHAPTFDSLATVQAGLRKAHPRITPTIQSRGPENRRAAEYTHLRAIKGSRWCEIKDHLGFLELRFGSGTRAI